MIIFTSNDGSWLCQCRKTELDRPVKQWTCEHDGLEDSKTYVGHWTKKTLLDLVDWGNLFILAESWFNQDLLLCKKDRFLAVMRLSPSPDLLSQSIFLSQSLSFHSSMDFKASSLIWKYSVEKEEGLGGGCRHQGRWRR